jgi:hypothetical protein
MAVFCGFVAMIVAGMVALSLVATAASDWSRKPVSWRVGQQGSFASAGVNRTVLVICKPGDAAMCKPTRPPEVKGYIANLLGHLTLAMPLAALSYGLFQACAGFTGIARGQPLARRTTNRLVRFAVAGLAFVLLTPFIARLSGVIADSARKVMNLFTGDRSFQVSAYSANYTEVSGLLTMVYAVALTLVAVILVKASRIADDHAQII